jgi:predicted ribosome quality control (RQC) complex YloA/Tae2 family protein
VFETDETKAALEYNIQQARHLCNCLIQIEISGDSAGKEMPLVVSVHTENGPRYEDFRTVLKTDALRNRFLDNFQKEIDVLQDRLQVYQQLAKELNPYVNKLKEAILECRNSVAA